MSDPYYDDAGPDVGVGVSTRQMDIARAKAEAKAKADAEAKAKAEAEAKAEKQRLDALAVEEEAEQRAQAEEQKRAPTKSYSDIDTSSAELERQVAHRELIDRLKETMASGRERVAIAKRTNLPDPDDFVGIPGPASRPREGSIREEIQEKMDTSLQKMETAFVDFETEMYRAGREMGAEAQEAYIEEDYTEAFLKGMAAFSARAGSGIAQGASFLFRPLAWGKTGEALVLGAKDVIEHPEDIPSGVQKWAENVVVDPASIVQFGGGIAGGYLTGSIIGEAYRSWKIRRLSKFYAEFPEEAFYIEDGIPDPRIPHPTDVERLVIKSKEQVRVIDDLGAGFLDEHKIATGSWPKSGTKGFGLRRTGHDLIPELIPEGMGRLETVYRFGLEYGQTHLPGVTGLPPYFEAALGLSPIIGVSPSLGAISGLLSGIPTLDKPLTDSKPRIIKDITPSLDDTGIEEKPKIIEMIDETYKQKPKPKPPITIPRPEPKITPEPYPPIHTTPPIEEPILEEDIDITTITITPQKTFQDPIPIQDAILDLPVPFIHVYTPPRLRSMKIPSLTRPKRKRGKQKVVKDPLGWEMKEYDVPSIEIMIGKPAKSKKTRHKKNRRLPPL